MTNASRVIRGGGETRRKTVIALALSFVMALMMLAQPVSAGSMMIIPDEQGDVGKMYDWETGETTNGWGDNAKVVQAGYFDMVSVWFGQKGKTYEFGMQLAADLPQAGDPLPVGTKLAEWNLYVDRTAWTPPLYTEDLFFISVKYDGSSFSANLLNYSTKVVIASLPLILDGSKFQTEVSADSIGDLPTTIWLVPIVKVWFGWGAFWTMDRPDPGVMPGQVMWSIPWPYA
jgi:hypothetical protein